MGNCSHSATTSRATRSLVPSKSTTVSRIKDAIFFISSLPNPREVTAGVPIRTPLVTVEPLTAYIGMKEGVTEKSKYEVLEVVEMEDGSRKYNRVGVIAPVPNRIWDNRFMAEEEGAPGATLGYTTFKKVSGKDFVRGMLIKEMSK